MNILWLRNAKDAFEELQDYSVQDLVGKIDCVLAEHGFARRYTGFDKRYEHNFYAYKGARGSALLKFIDDGSELIPLVIKGNMIARCPVYIHLKKVPQRVVDSIKRDVKKI